MVKKFTLLELHLDNARFSNAIGGMPEQATELLGGTEPTDDEEMVDDEMMDAEMAEQMDEESAGRSRGRTLGMLAFAFVVALGVRALARRVRSDDVDVTDDDGSGSSVEVDVDEPIDA